jgi:hypothetical protein
VNPFRGNNQAEYAAAAAGLAQHIGDDQARRHRAEADHRIDQPEAWRAGIEDALLHCLARF